MRVKCSQRISLLSAVLALVATAVSAWLVMRVLYTKMPMYEEFVTGYTSWTAYYKSGDMTLAYLVLGGTVLFYVLFFLLFSLQENLLAERRSGCKERVWKWMGRNMDTNQQWMLFLSVCTVYTGFCFKNH